MQHSERYDFTVRTPFSNLGVSTEDDTLVGIQLIEDDVDITPLASSDKRIAKQIRNYCSDPQQAFDMQFELRGTPFQKRVWTAMQKIPAGSVKTYGELAGKLKTSARAVGNACRSNRLLLVVPCHRVVSAAGLGGFHGQRMGKWTAIKRQLLAHEGVRYE